MVLFLAVTAIKFVVFVTKLCCSFADASDCMHITGWLQGHGSHWKKIVHFSRTWKIRKNRV